MKMEIIAAVIDLILVMTQKGLAHITCVLGLCSILIYYIMYVFGCIKL